MLASGLAEELRIRAARVDDAALLVELIGELAKEEGFPDPVTVTGENLRDTLFGSRPAAEAVIVEVDGAAAGFAIFYETFSSTSGRRGLHLDDLYVRPSAPGKGLGRNIVRYLARIAVDRGCGRFEWWALQWNEAAARFYEQLGARRMKEIEVFRLAGNALERAAREP